MAVFGLCVAFFWVLDILDIVDPGLVAFKFFKNAQKLTKNRKNLQKLKFMAKSCDLLRCIWARNQGVNKFNNSIISALRVFLECK